MFKNYLKTAIRFLLKNKTFSLINIVGLAMGTLCCLYIVLYVQEEYGYDKHHRQAGDIYRVNSMLGLPGAGINMATTSPPIVPAMKREFPEVKQFTRVIATERFGVKQHLLRYKEHSFYEREAAFADSTFFDVFTYHFFGGDPATALREPYSVVLKKSVADKLFGPEDPIGKMISIDNDYGKHDFKVTGVVDESLGRTHIQANFFMNMNSGGIGSSTKEDERWAGDNYANSYVKLRPDANAAVLQKKLPAFLHKYGDDQLKRAGMVKVLTLQRVQSIHTTTGYENEMDKPVSSQFLYILILIAILIQVIACINFMNLSTARASMRAKEVGVRKVIGAGRLELMKQFLGESFMLSLMGVALALPLLFLLLPYLNQLTGAEVPLNFLHDYRIWLVLVSLVTFTGLVAGSYPAFYLSAFQAIKVIKGNFTNQVSAAGIRRSLVVFQFVLSIALIAGIIVIHDQLHYIQNRDLGFDRDQKLIFGFYTADTKQQMEHIMSDLRQMGEVKAVTKSSNYPSQFIINDEGFYMSGGNPKESQDIQFILTDEHFVKAFGIKMINGREFHPNDSNMVLANETLIRRLGLDPGKAIGTRLYDGDDYFVTIVGVMKDFNYNSLHGEIKPFMLRYAPNGQSGWAVSLSKMIVNTSSADYKGLLGKIEAVWHKDLPGVPFDYAFLDDEVQKQYEAEITMSRIINSFTAMAIIISCLGLFGLAAFSAEQRNREIGIRKVLGASVQSIVQLLSKDFLKLVGIAILIATPIAWWAMDKWLQAFVYRIRIEWWMFALAGLLAIVVALLTVSSQAIRAALLNPAKSLKGE